jgi:hypothetical protein
MDCYQCGKQSCIQNGQLWNLVYNLQKTNNKKIVLTSEQRFALCNYMSGKPYNRKILQQFIK